MWDWDRGVRLPLVAQELERALARQRQRGGGDAGAAVWQEALDEGRAVQAGRDAEPILLARYRKRPAQVSQEGRLGGRAWGLGRGAAPPRFGRGGEG
jgi:hypothetical protein